MNNGRTLQLAENELRALSEIKRRVSGLYPVAQFVVFGSKARGDARPDSDIDLLIVTTQRLGWRECDGIIGEVYEVNLTYGTLFTATTVAEEDWSNDLWAGLALRQNVEIEGIVV